MEITKPILLIDKEKCLRNIKKMTLKARNSKCSLNPHFKTHISSEIGSWFKAEGLNQCTVSSVSMAKYFATHGWKEITIAFPYNPLEAQEISQLGNQIKLNILIESERSLIHASKYLKSSIGYYIEVDVGFHRTGIDPHNKTVIQKLINPPSKKMNFKGFYTHAGHTYNCIDYEGIKYIFDNSSKILTELKKDFGGIISYGDTPSCSLIQDLSPFDELCPGNFIFYDWMQHIIHSCSMDEIAICLACPVVATYEERNEIVIYGGAVHLSKDMIIEKDTDGKTSRCFGKIVQLSSNGWSTEIIGHIDRLSQEHGVIKLTEKNSRISIGDVIGVIPVHSCLTANLQRHYLSTTGNYLEKMTKN